MTNNKTIPNDNDVVLFLNTISDEQKRKDAFALVELMKEITKEDPKMWGASIVGFGEYHYKYESGREGDMFLTGFSPRKNNLTIYIMTGFESYHEQLLQLGTYKTGKSCLYVKKLEGIDQNILKEIITDSIQRMIDKYH